MEDFNVLSSDGQKPVTNCCNMENQAASGNDTHLYTAVNQENLQATNSSDTQVNYMYETQKLRQKVSGHASKVTSKQREAIRLMRERNLPRVKQAMSAVEEDYVQYVVCHDKLIKAIPEQNITEKENVLRSHTKRRNRQQLVRKNVNCWIEVVENKAAHGDSPEVEKLMKEEELLDQLDSASTMGQVDQDEVWCKQQDISTLTLPIQKTRGPQSYKSKMSSKSHRSRDSSSSRSSGSSTSSSVSVLAEIQAELIREEIRLEEMTAVRDKWLEQKRIQAEEELVKYDMEIIRLTARKRAAARAMERLHSAPSAVSLPETVPTAIKDEVFHKGDNGDKVCAPLHPHKESTEVMQPIQAEDDHNGGKCELNLPSTLTEEHKEVLVRPNMHENKPQSMPCPLSPQLQKFRVKTSKHFSNECCGFEEEKKSLNSKVKVDSQSPEWTNSVIEQVMKPNKESNASGEMTSRDLLRFMQAQITESNKELAAAIHFPPTSMDKFSGDPLEYKFFKSRFKCRVQGVVTRPADKLQLLQESVIGPALDTVLLITNPDPVQAYSSMWQALDKRFGQSHLISNAYIQRLNQWPTLLHNDDAGLRKLASFMNQCVSAMRDYPDLCFLNFSWSIADLVKKLPAMLQHKWMETVRHIERSGRVAMFSDLADTVTEVVETMDHPLYGKQALSRHRSHSWSATLSDSSKYGKPNLSKMSVDNSATGLSAGKGGAMLCVGCCGKHDIENCVDYMAKEVQDRKAFAIERQLCFACLSPRHIAKNCVQRRTCKVCKRKHPTSLHEKMPSLGQ